MSGRCICVAPVPARGALLAIALGAIAHSQAHAVTSNWNTDASGSFTTAANWDNGVPDGDDTAVFNRGSVGYTVTFPGNSLGSPPRQHVIGRLVVRTNEVSLADNPIFLQSAVVTVAASDPASIVVGAGGGDVAILNTTLSGLSGMNASIADGPGSNGTLNVSAGMVTLRNILVGFAGTGTLSIIDAGRVSTEGGVAIGILNDTSGTVTVRGAASSLLSTGGVTVASMGTGTLNVLEGGALVSQSGKIGLFGLGTVHVDGEGSMWTNSAGLLVGDVGTGMLDITSGGKISSAQGSIGNNPNGATSAVTISDAGSAWTNSGELLIGDAGRGALTVTGGGDVASDDCIIADQAGSSGVATVALAGSTWTNTGNLTVGGLGTATLNINSGGSVSNMHAFIGTSAAPLCIVSVAGAGSTWHSAGDLTIGRQGIGNSGTLIVSDGGVASVDGLLVVEPTGIIVGNSMIDADVINRGEARPGLLAIPSSGALHVDGSYLQSQSGRLSVRLGGTMPATLYDQLQVTGAVTLNGTLSVVLANSFQPSDGNVFNIIDGSSISGTFSTIQLPVLAAGLSWNTSQLYSAGVLRVIATPAFTADFDEDGDVDGNDLGQWRGDFAVNGLSDADNDGDSDGADFLAWQRQFGRSGTAAAIVSEPTSLALTVLALWLPGRRFRKRR